MNSFIHSHCGRPLIEVGYDLALMDSVEAERFACIVHGFRPGQLHVVAYPIPSRMYVAPASEARAGGSKEQEEAGSFAWGPRGAGEVGLAPRVGDYVS